MWRIARLKLHVTECTQLNAGGTWCTMNSQVQNLNHSMGHVAPGGSYQSVQSASYQPEQREKVSACIKCKLSAQNLPQVGKTAPAVDKRGQRGTPTAPAPPPTMSPAPISLSYLTCSLALCLLRTPAAQHDCRTPPKRAPAAPAAQNSCRQP